MTSSFRIGFVPGVTLGKWLRVWNERMPRSPLDTILVAEDEAETLLRKGELDMCFVRLPVDREGLHLIPLYAEVPVVVLPKEHVLTLLDEVTTADLADEFALAISPELSAKQAIETVAAGTGVVTVPMSVARLHHRKDVATRPVTDLPETEIGLAWLKEYDDSRVETFIGVVRGRSVRSSRGGAPREDRTRRKPRRSR
jgi:DNA-binding transcriptional LysR family regulator